MTECESVLFNNILYCCGGLYSYNQCEVSMKLNEVRFSKSGTKVKSLSSMKNARRKHVFISINENDLCALGGIDGVSNPVLNCEVYDIKANRWKPAGNLNHPRICPTACSFDEKFVYIFGGKESKNELIDSSFIEYRDFSIIKNNWNVGKYNSDYAHPDPMRSWCTQINNNDIIIFGTERITIFDTTESKLYIETSNNSKQERFPDRRGQIKKYEDNIVMILEANGNVGIYSLNNKQWDVIPHIMLGITN